jgi:hypothetical protein
MMHYNMSVRGGNHIQLNGGALASRFFESRNRIFGCHALVIRIGSNASMRDNLKWLDCFGHKVDRTHDFPLLLTC